MFKRIREVGMFPSGGATVDRLSLFCFYTESEKSVQCVMTNVIKIPGPQSDWSRTTETYVVELAV